MSKHTTQIPNKWIGPLKINILGESLEIRVPVTTYETTLWPSLSRGAKISREVGGINVAIKSSSMTRSIIIESSSLTEVQQIDKYLKENKATIIKIVESTSNYCRFLNYYSEIVGNLIFIRLSFDPSEASGHNMTTKAAEAIQQHILKVFPSAKYVSISGNICTDKKNSSINAFLGRGKDVTAEVLVSHEVCNQILKTTPQKIHDLNVKKNLLGSILSGGVRSANAHYANILLSIFLATGQDGANIVEGSQGITYTSIINGSLYFSVNLPNIITGVIGNGKGHDFVNQNLKEMECFRENDSNNSNRLSGIIAGAVLCSELSLLAAQTNPGELMHAHEKFERSLTNNNTKEPNENWD